jgi:hypothetical protein
MTLSEALQLVNAGGVALFAWMVYQEIKLLRPTLEVMSKTLATMSGIKLGEEREKASRAPTPPVGVPVVGGPDSS